MNILIYGIGGTIGSLIYDCLKEETMLATCCGIDKLLKEKTFDVPVYSSCDQVKEKVDCIIDFSNHTCVRDFVPFAVKNKIPCVIATTGFNADELEIINNASKTIPIFKTGNMSLGINIIQQLVQNAIKLTGDKANIEIIEMHHKRKVDAPSGTAIMLADTIKNELPNADFVYGRNGIVGSRKKDEIGIHSIRGGSIIGKHEVLFILDNEIITITHESENKTIFAKGAINAAKFIVKQKNGIYGMKELLQA